MKNINKLDLKNGMKFIERNGNIFYIVGGFIYKKEVLSMKLIFIGSQYEYFKDLKDDLTHRDNNIKDIMEVYDSEGNIIFERKETKAQKLQIEFQMFCNKQECAKHNKQECIDCKYYVGRAFRWLEENYSIEETKKEKIKENKENLNKLSIKGEKGLCKNK